MRNATLEKMSVFGPVWEGGGRSWNTLQSSGVTALSCTFYEMRELDDFRRAIPEARDPTFAALLPRHKPDKEELLFVT